MIYFDLFFCFAKIGCFSFGGGYAILPLLNRIIVEQKEWCSHDDILNYYAIGQVTPGVISVNTSTFVGYKVKGVFGAIAATLGMISPSIIIICLIANYLNKLDSLIIQHALNGIKIAICVLMFDTIYKLFKKSISKPIHYFLFLITLLLSILKINNVYIVLTALLFAIGCSYYE